jgi:hypothetical protein
MKKIYSLLIAGLFVGQLLQGDCNKQQSKCPVCSFAFAECFNRFDAVYYNPLD